MKKIILLIFLTLLFAKLNSLGTLRVESIMELPVTHTNIEVLDADGKYAPVLIIKTELKGLGFQNIGRPTKHAAEYMSGDHYYKFYMNDNQRVVKITHSDYEPLEVRLLADYGINIKTQRVYELELTNVPEKEFINVVIISDPPNSDIYLDNKLLDKGKNFIVSTGKHNIQLKLEGYQNISDVIDVTKNNIFFEYLFTTKNDVLLEINTIPTASNIFLNNIMIGESPILKRYPEGLYQLKVLKNDYKPYSETISLRNGINVKKEIVLINLIDQKNSKRNNISVTKSILRSSVLPGWGHFYINKQLRKGMVIAGVHTALCAGLIYSYLQFMDKFEQYEDAHYIEDIENNYSDANKLYRTSQIFLSLDLILWIYSLFDVVKSNKDYNNKL